VALSREGAEPRRVRLGARWRGWQRHHSQSAADSLARILRHPLASTITWLVIGVAIALPVALWLLLENVGSLGARVEQPAELSLFLRDEITLEAAAVLAEEVAGRPQVAAIRVKSREEALAEFQERSGLGQVAASLPENPLPNLLILRLQSTDTALVGPLVMQLRALPQVQEVVFDAQWLQRLERFMALGRRLVQLLGALLLGAVVLVLGNTIRLAIESRREEIEVIKLVGGSDAFVRRPLLYTGLWYGLGGGLVAALLLALGVLLLAPAVAGLAEAYGSDFRLRGLGILDSLQLVLMGGGLGVAGAWLAVARHLKDVEPHPI
jgi:cell division transport system permease protein